MHAEFSYAHFEWLFIVHSHHCTVKSGARTKSVKRPVALQCMTLKCRHKTECEQWNACKDPLNKILIKYFMSYIKKCQTGTYFFG